MLERGLLRFFRGGQLSHERLLVSIESFSLVKGYLLDFFRGGQPGDKRLLVSIEGFGLVKGGLLCFFRGGQSGGQRLLIRIQRSEARAEPLIFSFGVFEAAR